MSKVITASALKAKTKTVSGALKRIAKKEAMFFTFTTHQHRQIKKDLLKIHSVFQELISLLMEAQYGKNYEKKENKNVSQSTLGHDVT